MHLLEHLVIESRMAQVKDRNALIPHYINGITLGAGLSFVISCHQEQFGQTLDEFIPLYQSKFHLTQKILENEQDLIAIENSGLPDLGALSQRIDKYYGKGQWKDEPEPANVDEILALYDLLIAGQQPVVLLLGDQNFVGYSDITKTIELSISSFQLQSVSGKPVFDLELDTPEYLPHIADFLGSESKKV